MSNVRRPFVSTSHRPPKLSWRISALFIAVCVVACVGINPAVTWSEAWLNGATMRLVSSSDVEELRFAKGGYVAITAGKRGGPLTGPLMNWSLSGGKLNIGFPDAYDSMELISRSPYLVVVRRRSGAIAEFELRESP